MKQIYQLSHTDAMLVIGAIQAELEKQGKGAAIAVADEHGELMAFLRTDGCPLASINNAIHKAFTASRERKESRAVGDAARKENFAITNFGDLRYTGWGGGVPMFHEGVVVGAVGVSGLPEEEDMVIARTGAKVISAE